LIGSILGVSMGLRGAAASAGDLIDRMGGSPLVVWCLAAVIVLLVVMVVSGRLWRGAVGYGLGVASAVGVVIVLGGVASAALPQPPAGDVDLRTSTESGVQASLTLSPAAVGRNALAVQLGGMPSAADQPLLMVRPLDGRVNSKNFPLAPEGDGVYVSDDVVLPFSGRWRAEIRAVPGATAEDPLVVDFDVQSNPGAVDGSGS
jgi:hypothetical protein